MKQFPVAIQVYSIRDAAEADFVQCMKDIKAMGYSGVELAGTYGMTAVEIKKILDEVGLALVSAHVGADLMWDDALMADYAATGMKYIAVPWFHKPTDQTFLADNIEKFRVLGERCKSFGLQLGYHNHDFELETVPGGAKCALEAYYDEIPADLLKTQLDLCWVKVGGKDPVEFLRRFPGRAPTVHIKDYSGTFGAEDFQLCPVGEGSQDVKGLLEAAEAVGTEWVIVEQDHANGGRTQMECAKISIEYLLSVMN
ncbi:MAG: sugar phosphate isomerase/epimerase [Ruminococcaceae bacterium]|nr:sugar phosphate isomerase/epimerase [Oscillospiraceae bacterium]